MVAIEVVALGVGALPLSGDGTVLAAAVVGGEALVAVGVVDRRDEQDHRLQPVGMLALGQFAQQDLRRLLALDLAGVDVGLDVDAQLAGLLDRSGCRIRRADHRQRHRPPFERLPECRQVHRPGCRLRHRVQEGHDVVVVAGFAEVAALGARLEAGESLVLLRLRTEMRHGHQ